MSSLIKGTWWTSAEDELLKAYIDEHGEGNWSLVESNSGLSRSSKSCRARWMTYLRPTKKSSSWTEEDMLRVTQLHAIMGNQWKLIASQLPGRTANEIKRFWKLRAKSSQAGRQLSVHNVMDKQIESNTEFIEQITARCSSLEKEGLQLKDSVDVHRTDLLTREAYIAMQCLEKRIDSNLLVIEHIKEQQDEKGDNSKLERLRQQQESLTNLHSTFVQPDLFNFLPNPNISGHTNFGSSSSTLVSN